MPTVLLARPEHAQTTLLFSELLTPRYPVSIRSEGKQKARTQCSYDKFLMEKDD